ncbi:peptidoglycan-binding protein [Streptomyces sp. JV176]|uniref:helix-turn-helix domain-containing protein n=1 Tax=Streptomyces sp. JV176 TaxID=858630 RepID=UPI002E78F8F4|nr:helix-turn-helix domain-containing protein [Streptomyces sp. JV176]MEE1804001.1 peptidoglycan-binding protein [Streptomyces sp. JV176]
MPRWKELPSELPEKDLQLLVQLRRLKDRSGLGLTGLAAKTGYSRSSWERYLNGKQPVPRGAVEELARACGADPTRLLVLHEVAAEANGRAAPGTEAGPETAETEKTEAGPEEEEGGEAGEPPSRSLSRPRRVVPLWWAVVGALVAMAASFGAGLLLAPDDDEPARAPTAISYAPGRTYECTNDRKDGAAYAGHSVTREALVDLNGNGRDVVEVQCLLRKHGFDPGEIDGLYGVGTKEEVRKFQSSRGLVDDGIVGPDTWGELRR